MGRGNSLTPWCRMTEFHHCKERVVEESCAEVNFRAIAEFSIYALLLRAETWNANVPGTDNLTSVPAAALLEILSSPLILVARSRIPAKPQCPTRPSSST